MDIKTGTRPNSLYANSAAYAKSPAFFTKPGHRRRAKQIYFPSGVFTEAPHLSSTISPEADERVTAGSEAKTISGN
jgi:hypothetical protein